MDKSRKFKAYSRMSENELAARLSQRVKAGEISPEEKAFIQRKHEPRFQAKREKKTLRENQKFEWADLIEPLTAEIQSVENSIRYFKAKWEVRPPGWDDEHVSVYEFYHAYLKGLRSRFYAARRGGISLAQFKAAMRKVRDDIPINDGAHWVDYVTLEKRRQMYSKFNTLGHPERGRLRQPFQRTVTPQMRRRMMATSVKPQ